MSEKKKLLEVDLYKPIQRYFVKQGFEVYGEVNDCDLVAMKEEELVVVELKKTLNIELLVQGAKRQKLTDQVYIAIPRGKQNFRSKKWKDICHLIRRLELGLILVSFSGNRARVDIHLYPTPFDQKKSYSQNKHKRNSLIKEVNGRSGDYNIGGSTRTKIMTAYKENCIQIACYLEKYGPLSPKKLRSLGTGEKTLSILNKNYYRWFEKVSRGVYEINDTGKQEVNQFPELVEYYQRKLLEEQN
ncbi:DUF2161 domain-containing phosphodiesterase [Litchfieldia salsa]|uniref:Uncharacterized protein n=1 Tax=Litchfieldia salsa TaxID=930152 RepID=A0A1H0RSA9_9BACI|nr:DUF2161 family putative PD-(D/E)XK-type phosphodiesterase [Litchfieldia salsa]SDP32323.1 hypothetical protein SAMN05216565_102361 [Litchfieldia salsa]